MSKSLGSKKEISNLYYSCELTEALNQKIINVLQERKINEIKLINMKEDDIRKIDGLSESQKNLIIGKISIPKPIGSFLPIYSGNL